MRFLSILISFWLIPVVAGAQLQFGSLGELLGYADQHGAAARQARLQPGIARQDVNIQASGLYPRVNAFASGDYYPIIATQVIPAEVLGGAPGTYLKAQFGLPYVFQAGTEISMPVVDLGKWAQLSKAKAQHLQAEWGSKAALENYHIQLMQAYYQVLVTREVQKLNSENMTVADELLRIVEARYNTGVLNPADLNRARNLRIDVQATNINYEKAVQQGINNLQSFLTTNDNIALKEELSNFNWPGAQTSMDVTDRAAWQEASMRVRVAELALSESRRSGLPKLGLNGRYAYNMQTHLDEGKSNVEFDVASINLRLDVPLFQGNYYRSLQTKNKLQLESARYDEERTRATLTQQQNDWAVQYRAAYDRNEVLKQKLAGVTENLRIAKLSMEEGAMEFDEFNNIFVEYNRARMEYIQNLADGVLYHLLSTKKF